jgi:hypothetical protein
VRGAKLATWRHPLTRITVAHVAIFGRGTVPNHVLRFDTLRDQALHAGSSTLVSSAQSFAGREIAKTAHLLTPTSFTCGACITGPERKSATPEHDWVYLWRMYNRHHRSQAGVLAISPSDDSGYVWRMHNHHSRPKMRLFVISAGSDWSYVWRMHNRYNRIDTRFHGVDCDISWQ